MTEQNITPSPNRDFMESILATKNHPLQRRHISSTRVSLEPIRAFGESEKRIIKLERMANADFDGDALNGNTRWIPTNESDYSARKRALGLIEIPDSFQPEMAKLVTLPQFFVENDWHAPLYEMLKPIADEEVVLPYPSCVFTLSYQEKAPVIWASQDPETKEIKVEQITTLNDGTALTFQRAKELEAEYLNQAKAYMTGGISKEKHADFMDAIILLQDPKAVTAKNEWFKQHVLTACIALEGGIAGKTPRPINLRLEKAKSNREPLLSYKILRVQVLKAPVEEGMTVINTGHPGLRFHARRSHWKTIKGERRRIKWYFAGNIELGVVVKDYKID